MADIKIPAALREEVIKMLGLEELEPAGKEAMVAKMMEILEKKISLRIMANLEPEEVEQFNQLPEAEINDFLQARKIDVIEIITTETQDFRDQLLMDLAYFEGKFADKVGK